MLVALGCRSPLPFPFAPRMPMFVPGAPGCCSRDSGASGSSFIATTATLPEAAIELISELVNLPSTVAAWANTCRCAEEHCRLPLEILRNLHEQELQAELEAEALTVRDACDIWG